MEQLIYLLIASIAALVVGIFIGRALVKNSLQKQGKELEEKAKLILKEAELSAENTKKNKMLEAKEHYLKLKTEFEEEVNKKKNLIISNENKLKQREQAFAKSLENTKKREAKQKHS